MSVDNSDTFSKMGRPYQERVVQALLYDHTFAEQMADVIDPKFFDLKYLQEIVSKLYDYKLRYKTYPSIEVLDVIVTREQQLDDALSAQVKEYLARAASTPLNGDTGYIQESSLEFCKKQSLKDAIIKVIDQIEDRKYDAIQSTIKEALNKGSSRDVGHEYMEGFASRSERSLRKSLMPTGWDILDRAFNGGWERGILATFIAPTGAGKSMFLVNCGASSLMCGLNVLYVTCEMADYKIGIRFDSYFSGVEINKVNENKEKVETDARSKVKGRLFIKEFPTKTATVQTIRSYVQRLNATRDFSPDVLIIDYADLLRGARSHGDKRFELESIYEDLRALAQELNCVVITADQTNRSGLEMDVVTIAQIGEAYAKATVCDVIMTVSRTTADKQAHTGRMYLAKSRLGSDGMVYPFLLNTSTVKVTLLDQNVDPLSFMIQNNPELMKRKLGEKFDRFEELKVKNSGRA